MIVTKLVQNKDAPQKNLVKQTEGHTTFHFIYYGQLKFIKISGGLLLHKKGPIKNHF